MFSVFSVVCFPLAAAPQETPKPFEARGRLVCLLEEAREHKVEVPPVHPHQVGFKLEGDLPAGGLRTYTVLRTQLAEALFVDARYKGRDLRLTGRVLPASATLEVTKFQWYKDGKLYDPYYWCEVCAIKSFDPSICACCQAPVEFRESPAPDK